MSGGRSIGGGCGIRYALLTPTGPERCHATTSTREVPGGATSSRGNAAPGATLNVSPSVMAAPASVIEVGAAIGVNVNASVTGACSDATAYGTSTLAPPSAYCRVTPKRASITRGQLGSNASP